ncbi:MAG: DUF4421 domain-containing protein [Ginsengibacter sp.]
MRKYRSCLSLAFIVGIITFLLPQKSIAQDEASLDSGYYITYPDKLMLRLYLSQKFAPFTISADASDKDLNYKTTSKLTLGAGFTYKSLTLNLGYGVGFLNPEKGRGKTKGLDLQVHIYPKKWAVDLLGTFKKGYYLDPKDNNGLTQPNYYLRPDFKRTIIGLSVFRVPNSGRFSYRAALNQNDWQIKSAGSVLYGGEAYFGSIKGDSALVPSQVNSTFKQAGIDKINFVSVGPGIGYAYTLVLSKHFFVTASAIGSLNVNFSGEDKGGSTMKVTSIIPGGIYKGALGYNSDVWSVSATIAGNALYVGSESSSKEYFIPTGNLRFTVAKKFGTRARS